MTQQETSNKLLEIGFKLTSSQHPEGDMFSKGINGIILHACPAYKFIETWEHECGVFRREFFISIDQMQSIIENW